MPTEKTREFMLVASEIGYKLSNRRMDRVMYFFPQTELAMRGSYGVAKEGGYELFPAPVAPAAEHFVL